jgi:hypothetical protein
MRRGLLAALVGIVAIMSLGSPAMAQHPPPPAPPLAQSVAPLTPAQLDQLTAGSGAGEYAQRLHSSTGAHDGLYWAAAAGADASPLGPLVASAEAQGYGTNAARMRTPYHGYFFREPPNTRW